VRRFSENKNNRYLLAIGLISLSSCEQKETDTNAMLENSRNKNRTLMRLPATTITHGKFMGNMQGNDNHAMQMMKGNQNLMGNMMKGEGVDMMKDSVMSMVCYTP
jgi:hypothetical protein